MVLRVVFAAIERQMMRETFVFKCSSGTYLDCVGKNLFGSNEPWPLEIREGDYCFLHHYEVGGLFGLWEATSNGGRNLVPGLWKGKFPYQVKVRLVLPSVATVPAEVLDELGADPAACSFDSRLDDDMATTLVNSLLPPTAG